MKFTISPRIVRVLGIIIVCLILANLGAMAGRLVFNQETVDRIVPLFDFDDEGNFPTLFSTLLLLGCAGLALLVGLSRRAQGARDGGYWLFLAAVFAYLGIDETVKIHERLIVLIRDALGTSGVLFFAWVIPYGLAALVLGVIYLRFLWRLPTRVRILILLAGGLYVAGALGMEMIGGAYFDMRNGEKDVVFALMATLEETLEMVGLTVFIYALLTYIGTTLGGISLQIAPAAPESVPVQAQPVIQPAPHDGLSSPSEL